MIILLVTIDDYFIDGDWLLLMVIGEFWWLNYYEVLIIILSLTIDG
jgi:hypothetical protein